MIFTKSKLDITNKEVRRGLQSPSHMHKSIMKCFENVTDTFRLENNILYKLKMSEDIYTLYTYSLKPLNEDLAKEQGILIEGQKDMNILFNMFEEGKSYKMNITLNPCKTVNGKKQSIFNRELRYNKVIDMLQQRGLDIINLDEIELHNEKIRRNKESNHKSFYIYPKEYIITAKIANKDLFINECLIKGIGRNKAFGCGMVLLYG